MKQIEGEGEEQSSLYEKMEALSKLPRFAHAIFQLKMMFEKHKLI